jgi:hypothetical protein
MDSSPPEYVLELPSASGLTYNPLTMIQAVNSLVQMGMEGALAVLRNARDAGVPPEGVLLVARVAFVPIDDEMPLPRLELGQAEVDDARAVQYFPLFPVALYCAIPFLIIVGYNLGGETNTSHYLDWCEQRCRLRELLQPSGDPLDAADGLRNSDEWAALGLPASHSQMIMAQALRLAAAAPFGLPVDHPADEGDEAGN